MGQPLSSEDRAALRRLLASDDWKPVQKMIDDWKREKMQICATAHDDHRFHQGYWRGVAQFEVDLRGYAQEQPEAESERQAAFERATNGRNADGGAY